MLSNLLKLLFNVLFVVSGVGLLLAYLSPIVAPSSSALVAFCGLGYPVFLSLFLVLGILHLVFSKKRKVQLVWTVVLVLGVFQQTKFFALHNSSSKATEEVRQVLSYNVRLFDLYRWSEEDHYHDSIVNFLVEKQPEILGIQEFFHADIPNVEDTRHTLTKALSAKDFHQKFSDIMTGEQYFGVVTFAKDKIINRGEVNFGTSQNNFCIYLDLLLGSDTLRVYNVHFASIRFEPEDYSTIEEGATVQGVRHIAQRLETAFLNREVQVNKVKASLDSCHSPFILIGDFNDTPASYAYGKLSEGLNDAFLECSWGVGSTYQGKFPSFRIDYILGSPEIKFTSFEVHPMPYSDHLPISAEFLIDAP